MKIRLYEHPFAVCAPRIIKTHSLAEWLLSHYGDTPQVGVQIYVGEPSAETEITHDVPAILAAQGEITVLQSPGFEPVSWVAILTNLAISMAASFVLNSLFGPGEAAGLENRGAASPNNSLGQRDNKVRVLERVEDIYGTVKSIPSMLMPTYRKYIDHKQVEYGYYCVGRGYYDIAEVRDGETLIADVTGSSAAVYGPFSSPNNAAPQQQIGDAIIDKITAARRSVEVDGITLKALNQVQLGASEQYMYEPNVGGDIIRQRLKRPNFSSVLSVGDAITVSMSDFLVELSPPVPPSSEGPGSPGVYETYNYSGVYEVAAVRDGEISLTAATWPITIPYEYAPPPDDGGGGGGGDSGGGDGGGDGGGGDGGGDGGAD